jgi:hypothetical protein
MDFRVFYLMSYFQRAFYASNMLFLHVYRPLANFV